jgi:feruloyl-CoA synthase
MNHASALVPDRLAPFRETWWRAPELTVRIEPGAVYLRNSAPALAFDANLISLLGRAARSWSDAPFLHERGEDGAWRHVTFGQFAEAVGQAAFGLAGLAPGARVAILATNSIQTAVATFAVMALGAVAVPLSPAYLAHPGGAEILATLTQAVGAVAVIVDAAAGAQLAGGDHRLADIVFDLSKLCAPSEREGEGFDLTRAAALLRPADPAKILFTSGSTGAPKAVVNTHGMLCSAITMIETVTPRHADGTPLAKVDWLPWHHTFGGNVNLHSALSSGAPFYIDGGSPTPAGLPVTLKNLADVGPGAISTVPAAIPPMLAAMQADPALARAIFRNLHLMVFGGAPLSPAVAEQFQALAVATIGRRIMFGSGYGMTETSGVIALVHWPTERTDLLGLPTPGVELKLVAAEDGRYECRVRGANVFAGYLGAGRPFDEEGFFLTGDAVRPATPGDWEAGLVYAGRLAEDFKLANGVWVRAGSLRAALLSHLGALARDVLIVGSGRSAVGALVVLARPADQAELSDLAATFNAGRASVSTRIGAIAALASPPDPLKGELSAKGSLNVSRTTENRGQEIDALFSRAVGPG